MAKRANSTSPFVAKLLAPLPEGESVQDRPFDAHDWITRLRDAGGEVYGSAKNGSTISITMNPANDDQWALACELRRNPLAMVEVNAALDARREQDQIDRRLGYLRRMAGDGADGTSNPTQRRVSEALIRSHTIELRRRGVREDVIQAALAGEDA